MTFDRLGLSPELLQAVADQGYETPTPVQAESIPLILAGRDVLAGAQTGTGKTAAFVLPILQGLHGRSNPAPTRSSDPAHNGRGRAPTPVRVLVLVPTRELALQVEEAVRTYGSRRPVRSVAIYGGVGYEPQFRALRRGVEIVVATPGRLIDHLEQGSLDLSRIEVLVLDEADRMLDMGFIRDIRRIVAKVPAERQTLLFSATFSNEIRNLATSLLRDPAQVDVSPRNTPAELVRHLVIRVDRERKRHLLSHLVTSGRIDQALVFTRTKHGANRLAQQLDMDGISAAAIHGNRSQSQRVRALNDFKAGRVSLLVATEVAARGIDIDALPHVVNFELPMVPEDYVHRIGRTGRAGADGDAISLVCLDEGHLLADIERLLGRRIETETVTGFEPDPRARAEPIRLRSFGVAPGAGRSPHGGADRSGRRRPQGRRPNDLAQPSHRSRGPHPEPGPAHQVSGPPGGPRPARLPQPGVSVAPAIGNRPRPGPAPRWPDRSGRPERHAAGHVAGGAPRRGGHGSRTNATSRPRPRSPMPPSGGFRVMPGERIARQGGDRP